MAEMFEICVVEHEFKTKKTTHEFYLATDAKLCFLHDSESEKKGIPLFTIQKKKTENADSNRKRKQKKSGKNFSRLFIV